MLILPLIILKITSSNCQNYVLLCTFQNIKITHKKALKVLTMWKKTRLKTTFSDGPRWQFVWNVLDMLQIEKIKEFSRQAYIWSIWNLDSFRMNCTIFNAGPNNNNVVTCRTAASKLNRVQKNLLEPLCQSYTRLKRLFGPTVENCRRYAFTWIIYFH